MKSMDISEYAYKNGYINALDDVILVADKYLQADKYIGDDFSHGMRRGVEWLRARAEELKEGKK